MGSFMALRHQSGWHQLVGSMAGIGQAFREDHRRLGARSRMLRTASDWS